MPLTNVNLSRVVIGIVAIVAVIGLFAYQSGTLPLFGKLNTNSSSTTSTGSALIQSNTTPPTAAERAAILEVPGPNASQEEKDRYFQLMVKFAQPTGNISLTNCQPDPLVLWVREGQSFTITNKDNAAHTVQITEAHKYQVDPQGSKTVKADFGGGPGESGIFCDPTDGAKIVGVIHVTK